MEGGINLIFRFYDSRYNLTAADGVEGFGAMIAQLAEYPEPPKVNVIRISTYKIGVRIGETTTYDTHNHLRFPAIFHKRA